MSVRAAPIYPTDCEEIIRYWSYDIEDDEEDDIAEEAVINSQETENVEN
jgi:hypothetical protein